MHKIIPISISLLLLACASGCGRKSQEGKGGNLVESGLPGSIEAPLSFPSQKAGQAYLSRLRLEDGSPPEAEYVGEFEGAGGRVLNGYRLKGGARERMIYIDSASQGAPFSEPLEGYQLQQ